MRPDRTPRWLAPSLLSLLALLLGCGQALAHDEPPRPQARDVDLVICLDTSGSMDGLIHAARQKLWSLVGEMATLEPEPRLRVGLLTFGSPGHDERGHVVLQTDLTADLDLVSEKLFALQTNGGTELVGRVLHAALTEMSWARGDGLKTIFVAGNESADQDTQRPFARVAADARARGMFVSAIYCGGADDADAAGWRTLAGVGAGTFAHIDQDRGTVSITTPFDAELARLSSEINATYVFHGSDRDAVRERQEAQDGNATAAGAPAAAERASAKASGLYRAPKDLVDESRAPGFALAEVPAEELPEELRALDEAGRKAYLDGKAADRERIRARIQELDALRAAHVRKAMDEQKLDDTRSLDRALRDAVREQAERKGFAAPSGQGG